MWVNLPTYWYRRVIVTTYQHFSPHHVCGQMARPRAPRRSEWIRSGSPERRPTTTHRESGVLYSSTNGRHQQPRTRELRT